MKKLFRFRRMFSFGIAAIVALFISAPLYAQGDYDLEMQSIEGNPVPLQAGCNNQIKPHFSINGADDHFVPSGGATVHIGYRTNPSSSYTAVGNFPVTYVASDGSFGSGELWPDNFSSVKDGFTNGNSFTFFIPQDTTQIWIKASVDYLPNQTDANGNVIVDTNPANNMLEKNFNVQTPQSCLLPSRILVRDICKVYPKVCYIRQCTFPGCLIGKLDPENCPQCSREGRFEVITRLSPEYSVVAYTKDGREVARSIPQQNVERVGTKSYNQKLVFESQKGESYTFKIVPRRGHTGKVSIKPDFQIREISK